VLLLPLFLLLLALAFGVAPVLLLPPLSLLLLVEQPFGDAPGDKPLLLPLLLEGWRSNPSAQPMVLLLLLPLLELYLSTPCASPVLLLAAPPLLCGLPRAEPDDKPCCCCCLTRKGGRVLTTGKQQAMLMLAVLSAGLAPGVLPVAAAGTGTYAQAKEVPPCSAAYAGAPASTCASPKPPSCSSSTSPSSSTRAVP
jgi:hypothetical protein